MTGADFTKKEHQFLVDGGDKSQLLIATLYEGYESAPRIKNGTVEIFKLLDGKLKKADESIPSLEKLLKITFKTEPKEGSEEPQHDEAKVGNIMKIFKAPAKASGPPKKDFRAFLK